MQIGIDVGGTFTDGVLIDDSRIIRTVKIPTEQDLGKSIASVFKELAATGMSIDKIVLSTTLVTNLLSEKKHLPVGMLLIPGPGLNPAGLSFACPTFVIQGAIDYRGRVVQEVELQEVDRAVEALLVQGISRIAVAAKFSQRNPVLENTIIAYLKEKYPALETLAAHRVSGLLNWVRRANGAALTLMIGDKYEMFLRGFEESLKKMNITCPCYVLKADGGTVPLDLALQYPLESVFSGPAASALGALAWGYEKKVTSVVMDIGGTTTDLALVLDNVPLLAERGVFLDSFPIPVKALAVSSLALGGDTSVTSPNGKLSLGNRKGKAYCLGGPHLTVTDILVYLEKSSLAKRETVAAELAKLAASLDSEPQKVADEVITIFLDTLEEKLEAMFKRWEEEPAYHIWQVLAAQKKRPSSLVCFGGPAEGLGRLWAEKKGWEVQIPPYATVANAVGAALAKTTLRLDLHADTEQKRFSTNLGGLAGDLKTTLRNTEEATALALSLFSDYSKEWQLAFNAPDEQGTCPVSAPEIIYAEGFNLIRGWQTTGKIFQIGLQTTAGIETPLRYSGNSGVQTTHKGGSLP